MELILDIIYNLKITKKDLETAKGTYRGRISLNFDRPDRVLGMALYDLNFENKIYTPEDVKANIDKVTVEEVKEVCKLILKPENLSMVISGDFEEMPIKL